MLTAEAESEKDDPAATISRMRWTRATAEDLLADNRLYRQTAEAEGQTDTGQLLEDLEEVLVEVAHAPAGSEELRRRIEAKGVLFAIQVRTGREGIL